MNEKQFNKRKKRERRVKEKLTNRRIARSQAEKKVRDEQKKQEAWIKLMEKETGTNRPFRHGQVKLSAEEVKKRLDHNLEILKALEEDFQREHPEAGTLKERLERAGIVKVNAPTESDSDVKIEI